MDEKRNKVIRCAIITSVIFILFIIGVFIENRCILDFYYIILVIIMFVRYLIAIND